jgi:hemerythrin-like domain-containing protein
MTGATTLEESVNFLRHFADECHHFKEEKLLFPLMEEDGIPREGEPIGMMLVEHEEEDLTSAPC